jgi:hypothetical protein
MVPEVLLLRVYRSLTNVKLTVFDCTVVQYPPSSPDVALSFFLPVWYIERWSVSTSFAEDAPQNAVLLLQ